jgi:hypothetical protein
MSNHLTIPALDRPRSFATAKKFFDTKHAELRARLDEAIAAAENTIQCAEAPEVRADQGLLGYYTSELREHREEIAGLRRELASIEALWTPKPPAA